MKRGNSASIFSWTRAARKAAPSSSRSTYGSATSSPLHAEARGDLGKLLREFRAHLAQVLQLVVVVAQQPRVHSLAPSRARSRISTSPVSRSTSVRSRTSIGTGCAHSSPRISTLTTLWWSSCSLEHHRSDLQRVRQDARLEVEDGLPDAALEVDHVQRRGRLARQRRQTEIDHRLRTSGSPASSSEPLIRVALNSQARSRRTACRSWILVMTVLSGGSFFAVRFVVGEAIEQRGLQAILRCQRRPRRSPVVTAWRSLGSVGFLECPSTDSSPASVARTRWPSPQNSPGSGSSQTVLRPSTIALSALLSDPG